MRPRSMKRTPGSASASASFAAAAREAYLNRGGKPVTEGFQYSSDSNPERLDARGLQSLLARALV